MLTASLRIFIACILRYWPLTPVLFGACSGSWVDGELTVTDLRLREPGTVPFPRRKADAITGRHFLETTANLSKPEREEAIFNEIMQGNVPNFMRVLVPIRIKLKGSGGRRRLATVWVTPNYLAIGSDQDHVFIPLNFYTATRIARTTGFLLPTPKLVREIYRQAQFHMTPAPIPASPLMETNAYFLRHNELVALQLEGLPRAALIAGHKKDVVISNILNRQSGRLAIYGWHRDIKHPIQPLSIAHWAGYADYSHGIRFVNAVMRLDDRLVSLYDVLNDPVFCSLASDEGVLANLGFMMAGYDSSIN